MNIDVNWAFNVPIARFVPTPHNPVRPVSKVGLTTITPGGAKTTLRQAVPGGERLASLAVKKSPAREPELYRRIESELPFLQRAARRWYRDKPNADDLIQDTVLQALANAHQWQAGTDLRAWLFTIMRNRFFGTAARLKRSDAALDTMTGDECSHAISPPEARLLMRDLERALRRLPLHQQIAVRLVGIEGRSYAEAAKLMAMSVAAVRCHLARGRARLQKIMEGYAARQQAHHRPKPRSPGVATEQTMLRERSDGNASAHRRCPSLPAAA